MSEETNFEKAIEFIKQPMQQAVVYKTWFENGFQRIGCHNPVFGKLEFNVDINKGIQRGDKLLIERTIEHGKYNFVIRGNLTKQEIISENAKEVFKDFTPQEVQYILANCGPSKQRE